MTDQDWTPKKAVVYAYNRFGPQCMNPPTTPEQCGLYIHVDEVMEKIQAARFEGYKEAVSDYGIWNDGQQTIGCQQTPIKEVIARKQREMGLTHG